MRYRIGSIAKAKPGSLAHLFMKRLHHALKFDKAAFEIYSRQCARLKDVHEAIQFADEDD
jgi:hypothetical protein